MQFSAERNVQICTVGKQNHCFTNAWLLKEVALIERQHVNILNREDRLF